MGFCRLTLNVPIATKVVCFSRLQKCLSSLYGKQCGPRSDCSYRSSLFWVHTVCFYTSFVTNVRHFFAADNFSKRHFQMHFFLGSLRVKTWLLIACNMAFYAIMYNNGYNVAEIIPDLTTIDKACTGRQCLIFPDHICLYINGYNVAELILDLTTIDKACTPDCSSSCNVSFTKRCL